ncbi:MAG: hypothetical protein L6Q97_00770 [Thermoanaerobaculia bacterium]|nr:hypothetical protein [Thermoanaerobaculia bacterium]
MFYFFKCLLPFFLLFASCARQPAFTPSATPVAQRPIPRVEKMPNHPKPYAYKDWRQTTLDFDRLAFDFAQKGEYWPLIWLDETGRNFPETTFGLYTAMGDVRMGPAVNNGENHEALGALGAVLGATLVGIDKSKQDGRNYVRMLRNYFNRENGWNVIMNFTNKGAHIGGGYGNDFWYEVHNNVLFYSVANFYPKEAGFDDILRTIADQFYRSDSVMGNSYSYSYFDFKNMKGERNHIPTQEDVAGGYAFVLYSAWVKFGDDKYLRAAKNALNVLYHQKENRFYEAMMPVAAYVAARMNEEAGANYDIQRFLDWTFDGTAVGREGWGVLADNWGGYDVSGLAGSTVHNGGYGFLMNTFDLMMPMSALVRYDQRYARATGKWALNASNAARFCYPYEIPDSLQAIPQHKAVTKKVIAYEGIIKESIYPEHKGITPFAQGDGPLWVDGNPQQSMFSVYGSGHVGFFGATIQKTNVPEILQIDCRATDFYKKQEAYPTYLFFNPYNAEKTVETDLGAQKVDVFDTVNRVFLGRKVSGIFRFSLPADAARVLVLVPAGKSWAVKNGVLKAGGVPVDYRYGR